MPTLILKQKITKGYEHWLAAFDGAEELRSGYGIKTIYRGLGKLFLFRIRFLTLQHHQMRLANVHNPL